MTKRAILYARVSGDDRKYATSGIESQLADCRRYAAERGYQVVNEVYETPDKVTSGADWLPELDRVLKLAQGSAFDVLVVREIDRLARNRFKQMSVEIQLEACGARVEYVIGQFEESAEGRLLKGLMSEFAEYEREKIKERTVRGVVRSVSGGNVMARGQNAPYGYEAVTVDGRNVLAINEGEATIVRLIFDLYVTQGASLSSIVRYLSDRHIAKPEKKSGRKVTNPTSRWSIGTVSSILNNETYTGCWHYRKRKRVKTPDGRAKLLQQSRDKWIEVKVPMIVNEATFRAAQQMREQNKREMGKQHKHFYLLGGMLRCGHCGRFASGLTKKRGEGVYRYYRCGTCQVPKRYATKCDNNHSYYVEAVDRAVWEWVKGIFLSPDTLTTAIENYQAKQSEAQSPILQMIESTAARLDSTEQEKARLLSAYLSGGFTLEEIAPKKVELDKRVADLTRALAELRAELNPATISQEVIDRIYSDAADLREGLLLADDDPLTQRRILKQLLLTGRLVYAEGKRWVEVDCVLGSGVVSTEYMLLWRQEIGNVSLTPERAKRSAPWRRGRPTSTGRGFRRPRRPGYAGKP